MKDERVVPNHLDQLGEVLLVVLDVDDALGVVEEHPEEAIYVKVDRRGLDAVLAERIDDDSAGVELFPDRLVGQDHGPVTLSKGWDNLADIGSRIMRKLTAAAFLVVSLPGVIGSAAPAGAAAQGEPVEIRDECGGKNIYIFGTPLITYVWCPPPA